MLSDRDYYNRPNPDNFWQRHSAIFLVIVANVAVFLLTLLTGGMGDVFYRSPSLLLEFGALMPCSQYEWQLWRLVTYQFLHADFWHLFFNMYGVWLFGGMVERELGKNKTLVLYLSSGVLGGIFFSLANWYKPAICVGASGSLFGLMVAAAIASPQTRMFLLIPPMPIKLWVMVLIYCGIEVLYALRGAGGNVAHLAHLGGALGGLLFMLRPFRNLFGGWTRRRSSPRSATPDPPRAAPPRNTQPFVFSQEELNRILDKMSRQGYYQLTEDEKEFLRQSSEELKRRRAR
ncbi:MAG: rhomboid family intramembrane serine protease [Victivallales bacterium]|nr:rhomboid family intramembrane serine protease [Victivallales bacterium]